MQGATHFLIKEYEKQGVQFDRMLLWEALPITGPQIFRTVPDEWYSAYQYFNVPVTTDVTSPKHPLQVLPSPFLRGRCSLPFAAVCSTPAAHPLHTRCTPAAPCD